MRRLLLGALLALTACQPGRQASEPPVRFQHDAVAAVRFLEPAKAAALCAASSHEPGVTPEGCNLDARVVLPNPCRWPGSDTYAQLACHELGHWNDWPADHPA